MNDEHNFASIKEAKDVKERRMNAKLKSNLQFEKEADVD